MTQKVQVPNRWALVLNSFENNSGAGSSKDGYMHPLSDTVAVWVLVVRDVDMESQDAPRDVGLSVRGSSRPLRCVQTDRASRKKQQWKDLWPTCHIYAVECHMCLLVGFLV